MRLVVVVALVMSWMVNAAPSDFDSAKRLARKIYPSQSKTWYCGCTFRWQGEKAQLDLASCGYRVRKNVQRAQRLEWEHVVPAQQFGHTLACWRQGGRQLCGKKDAFFNQMEGDLYNLRPAIGEVNGDRAHYRYSELTGTATEYGNCPIQIDSRRELAEPADAIKGDTARIYFYMMERYNVDVTDREYQLFLRWHQQDPVDDVEFRLNHTIARYMGWPNPYVTEQKQPTKGAHVQVGLPAITVERQAPTQQQVLGNKQSKKYHLSHCVGFTQVSAKNQVRFDSEQQAIDAGYHKAGNCK